MTSYLDLALEGVRFCVLDTETTGFDPGTDRVVDVAGVWCSLGEGIQGHVTSLVNPGRLIPANATKIHGIRDEDVVDAVSLEVAMAAILVEPFDLWAAHNVAFDFGFVSHHGRPTLCTLQLARRLWPTLSHTNQDLRVHWKLVVPQAEGLPAHRAAPDAMVTAALLRLELETLRERMPEIQTLRHLLDWMAKPVLLEVCFFGKNRGKPWQDIPKKDIQWALKKFEPMDIDLRFTLEHYSV